MSDMVISTIEITRVLTEDGGDEIFVEAKDSEGNLPPLVELLGMVELARDTCFKMCSGELDEDEEEPEYEDDET